MTDRAAPITLYTLDRMGLIVVSGEDAQRFLHGQLTCDVIGLAVDRSTYGAYCTAQGRVLTTFLLWRSGEDFFMQLPETLRESIRKNLSKFILRAKVKVSDAGASLACIGVAGEDAASRLRHEFGTLPAAAQAVCRRESMTLIRLPHDRYEICMPSGEAAVMENFLNGSTRKPQNPEWDLLEIRSGIPWITPVLQEEFVPQSLNLDALGGVSFTKGCYPGQEIVARLHYRGQVKQRLYRVRIAADNPPQPGDRLYGSDAAHAPCGRIVSVARTSEGGYEALAAIQTVNVQAGAVHWKDRDGPALDILTLPYAVR